MSNTDSYSSDDANRDPAPLEGGSIFSDRNFVHFLIGQAITTQGLWVQKIAMSWLAWSLTHSAFWTGLIAALNFAPAVLLGPLFGVMADRVDLRRTAVTLNLLMTVTAVLLMALSFSGMINLAWLVTLAAANGIIASANTPVRLSLVPIIVRREHMSQAVAFTAMNFNIARLVGPALGGVIIATWGTGAAFLINAITYVPMIYVLATVKLLGERTPDTGKRRLWTSLLDGAGYALRHRMIRAVLALSCFVSLTGYGLLELLPVFAEGVFNRGVTGLGMLASAGGIGAVCSTFMLSRIRSEPGNFQRIAILGAVLAGCGALGLGLVHNYGIAVVLVAVTGFGLTSVGVGSQTALQLAVDSHLRGRVMSFWSATSFGGIALGGTLLGAISEASHIQLTARGCGVLLLIAAPVALWRLRRPEAIS